VCEQLAQSCYLTVKRPGVEAATSLDRESDALTKSHTVIILANLNAIFLFMDNINISILYSARFCVTCHLLYAGTVCAECADRILSCKMLMDIPSLKSTVQFVNAKTSAAGIITANLRLFFNSSALLGSYETVHIQKFTDACIH